MSIFIAGWPLFCIAFGLMLLLSLIMKVQGLHFYTKDVVLKKFNILDLEFPATSRELVNLIAGLYKLEGKQSKKTISALKSHLYLDFLFMPCAYGAIFLLCLLMSDKMENSFGVIVFSCLAWAQLISWLLNIIANIYLLRKIHPDPVLSGPAVHKAYFIMEIIKWGITLIAVICCIASVFYFWLSGFYALNSLIYLLIIAAEIILFLILGKLILKNNSNALLPQT